MLACEHDRRARLHGQCHDPRSRIELHPHLVCQRRHHPEPGGALAARYGPAITDQRRARVLRARHTTVRGAVPPLVEDHAMNRRNGSCGNRCVPGARNGIHIGASGTPKPCAAIEEPSQAARPLMLELLDVVGAQLVDRQDHDQPWSRGRRRSWILGERPRAQGDQCDGGDCRNPDVRYLSWHVGAAGNESDRSLTRPSHGDTCGDVTQPIARCP